jgi:ribosomal protein RSM22 (predicted rRNA methylase)
VALRVCAGGTRIERAIVSRRAGPLYRAARDLEWGDRVADGLVETGPTDAGV